MAKPLDPKEVVTVQELAISNMLEIAVLRELLFEKGIITKDEFLAEFKKLDREIKEGEVNISIANSVFGRLTVGQYCS